MHFEKKEYPLGNGNVATSYELTDDYGHTSQFTPEQAHELLDWLYQQKDELFRVVHGITGETPQTG